MKIGIGAAAGISLVYNQFMMMNHDAAHKAMATYMQSHTEHAQHLQRFIRQYPGTTLSPQGKSALLHELARHAESAKKVEEAGPTLDSMAKRHFNRRPRQPLKSAQENHKIAMREDQTLRELARNPHFWEGVQVGIPLPNEDLRQQTKARGGIRSVV